MSLPIPQPEEKYVITLTNGVNLLIGSSAFDEILKVDRKDSGAIVRVSPTNYVSTRYIISAFKQDVPDVPAEATSEVPLAETPVDSEVPVAETPTATPVDN